MKTRRKGQARLIISLLLILIAIIFVVLNAEIVTINFGFFHLKLPLIVILVVMMLIGALLGWFMSQGRRDEKKDE